MKEKIKQLDYDCNKKQDYIKYIELEIKQLDININNNIINEESLEKYRNDLDILKQYEEYYNSKTIYDKYHNKYINLKYNITECEDLLSCALQFKRKIVEAESIALTNLVNTININVQHYLDAFFEKEPLPQDHKLRFLPNALVLPHIGYVTAENYSKFYPQMIENLQSCLENKPLRTISN